MEHNQEVTVSSILLYFIDQRSNHTQKCGHSGQLGYNHHYCFIKELEMFYFLKVYLNKIYNHGYKNNIKISVIQIYISRVCNAHLKSISFILFGFMHELRLMSGILGRVPQAVKELTYLPWKLLISIFLIRKIRPIIFKMNPQFSTVTE